MNRQKRLTVFIPGHDAATRKGTLLEYLRLDVVLVDGDEVALNDGHVVLVERDAEEPGTQQLGAGVPGARITALRTCQQRC